MVELPGYRERPSRIVLAGEVAALSVWEDAGAPFVIRVVPDGCSDIVFSLEKV